MSYNDFSVLLSHLCGLVLFSQRIGPCMNNMYRVIPAHPLIRAVLLSLQVSPSVDLMYLICFISNFNCFISESMLINPAVPWDLSAGIDIGVCWESWECWYVLSWSLLAECEGSEQSESNKFSNVHFRRRLIYIRISKALKLSSIIIYFIKLDFTKKR